MGSVHTIPLHIGDLITDTMHLSAAELGAYIRLITVHYRMGADGLPDDDNQLRRITGLDNRTWKNSRVTILSYFALGENRRWVHGKVQKVLSGIQSVQVQNRAKALKRWQSGDAAAVQEQCTGPATAMQSRSQKPEAIDSVAKATSSPPTPKPRRIPLAELTADHNAEWLDAKRAEGRYLMHDEHFILEYFKNYCTAKGKKYANYLTAYRNAFEWNRCQPSAAKPTTWVGEGDRLVAKYLAEERAGQQGQVGGHAEPRVRPAEAVWENEAGA